MEVAFKIWAGVPNPSQFEREIKVAKLITKHEALVEFINYFMGRTWLIIV